MPESIPSPTIQSLVFSLLRSILMFSGAVGLTWGSQINDGTLMAVSGAIVALATATWSIYDKFRAALAQHDAAVASARARTPVTGSGK